MINNIITTKDYIINVTSHYNNFMISNIIHGCIDLSENADNFFKNLTKLIKDKPLYKVYGKIPIKLEVKYSKDWYDPLKEMELAIFMQSGGYSPYWSRFGYVRNGSRHQGIDLFAVPGTPVYACCDAKIAKCETNVSETSKGYGKEIVLAVTGTHANRLNKVIEDRIKYYEKVGLLYSSQKEILYDKVNPFKRDSDTIYIRYAHLSKIADGITKGSVVKAGQQIGFSGTTGVKKDTNLWGTHAPHLHFEILSHYPAQRLEYRINPIVLIDFRYPDFNDNEQTINVKFQSQVIYKDNYSFKNKFIIEGQ